MYICGIEISLCPYIHTGEHHLIRQILFKYNQKVLHLKQPAYFHFNTERHMSLDTCWQNIIPFWWKLRKQLSTPFIHILKISSYKQSYCFSYFGFSRVPRSIRRFLSYSINKTTFSFFGSYLANVTNVSIVSTFPHTLLFLLSYTIQKASE